MRRNKTLCEVNPRRWLIRRWLLACLGSGLIGTTWALPSFQEVKAGWRAFDAPWAVEEPEGTFLQACTSPVWDTLLTQLAYLDCGEGLGNPEFDRSLDWVLNQQILVDGDWKIRREAQQ